jgi:hypothetical protein
LISAEIARTSIHEADDMTFRLKKIRELANALVPRIEAKYAAR